MEALLSARNLIAKSLQQSNLMSSAIEASSCNLQSMNSNLTESSDLLRSVHNRICTLSAINLQADHALGPTSAHSSVLLLQRSISAARPSDNLSGYLASVHRLEQALAFQTENCALAIQWLNDVASLLDESSVTDQGYVLNVRKSLAVLVELKSMEVKERLPGGCLSLSMDRLELELHRIFETEIHADAVKVLCPIADRLRSNGRGSRIGEIYVEVRVSTLSQQSESESESESEDVIAKWVKDVEFAVKEVIQYEHDVCKMLSSVISMDQYGEIVAESGFLSLLGSGSKMVRSTKKDAVKLLKLLDMFGALDELRGEFNKLFGGKECERVQEVTRDLVRSIVEGAFEIFSQLAVEVKRQPTPPSLDDVAGVPRVLVFVTDYCRVLVGEKYRNVLLQVVSIHGTWQRCHVAEEPHRVLAEEICRILGALEVRLNKWSKKLGDAAVACFFLMNNYRYLHDQLKETELGNLVGEERLTDYGAKMELYAAAYVDHTACRKLPTLGTRMSAYT